jgi:hypothetical protein
MISRDVRDMAGNCMAEPYSWSFRTASFDALPPYGVKVMIGNYENVYQGHYAFVYISVRNDSTDVVFGGFDFLIGCDASALIFMNARLSDALDGCWEYFTYRFNWQGNCGEACPSGLLRVVGIADINNGPNHPDPSCILFPSGTETELFWLQFYVTNDRAYECEHIPIRFFWDDCGDNVLVSHMGDTLWLSRHVYDYDPTMFPQFREIPGEDYYGGHWWLGNCENDDPERPTAIPRIDFYNGDISIICSDSIEASGDLNLNGIANEVADAMLYTNYFIYGLSVFEIYPEGQIAASEVNRDGRALTVADLVYLIRIITGDALPFEKLTPYAYTANILFDGTVVSSGSAVDIGAALFVFDGAADVELLADGMEFKSDVVDGQTRVLVWSDGIGRVPAGNSNIFTISGDVTLAEVSISDYYGNLMNVEVQ